MIDKEFELLFQMMERVMTDADHNELLKRSICFGTSGRYGWLCLLEGKIQNQDHCIKQTISLVKVDVDDIVPLWEQIVSQQQNDPSYYLHVDYFFPIYQILKDAKLHPAWTKIRAAKRGSNSMIFDCHVSDYHSIMVDRPDLSIKVFLDSSYEVQILNSIKEQTDPERSPVKYVLSTWTAVPQPDGHFEEFYDAKATLIDGYLGGRRIPSLPTFFSMSYHEKIWWNFSRLYSSSASSAILMLYGQSFHGPLEKVQTLLTSCLRKIHDCNYLHTDLRPNNWLLFPSLKLSEEQISKLREGEEEEEPLFFEGTPLLIDFDQAVKMEDRDKKMLVTTRPGARRAMMLSTLFKPDSGLEEQLIKWSIEDEFLMLQQMLLEYSKQTDRTTTQKSLTLSFNNLSMKQSNESVPQQPAPEEEVLQMSNVVPIVNDEPSAKLASDSEMSSENRRSQRIAERATFEGLCKK